MILVNVSMMVSKILSMDSLMSKCLFILNNTVVHLFRFVFVVFVHLSHQKSVHYKKEHPLNLKNYRKTFLKEAILFIQNPRRSFINQNKKKKKKFILFY